MIDYTIIEKWYGGYIPTFNNLLDFSIKSNILTKGIIPTPITLDKMAETAYMKDGKCVLPALFFTKKFYTEYLGVDEQDAIYAAIAVINGSQLHESLHNLILGANANFITVTDHCLKSREFINKYYTQVFKDCFNIIEDVYSNYYCYVNYPSLNVFVDLLIKTVFNKSLFDKSYENLYTNKNVKTVLNCLVCSQNDDNLTGKTQFEVDYKEHVEVMLSARNVNLSLNDRFDLAEKLYTLLAKEFDEDDDFSRENSDTGIDNNSQFSNQEIADFSSIYFADLNEIYTDFVDMVAFKKPKEMIIDLVDIKTLVPRHYVESLPLDKNFNGFSQYIQNARALKPMPIEPKYTGQVILTNRLFSAKIDGKIFSKRDTQVFDRNYPEIIFLGDGSGSMASSNLLRPVAIATKTIFKDLKENNIGCAVYFHTTRYGKCIIYAVASNNMPFMNQKHLVTTQDYEKRFDAIPMIDTAQNADGYAIEFISKRFSDKPGKKVIVVLSDGLPSFGYSGGEESKNHIRNLCKNLRGSNISVVSLSLTDEVMSNNSELYGEKNNIAAYGSNLQNNLKKLVSQIVI